MRKTTTPLLLRAAATLGAALFLSGCAAAMPQIRGGVSCLSGPVPHVGRAVPDEMFALLRRERDRAAGSSPLVKARVLESLHDLFPDVSDLWPEPPCHDELEAEGIAALSRTPLVFDREVVARTRTVHDAGPLMRIATMRDADLPAYKMGPDEHGTPPSPSFLRYRALANIPAGWIADNRADGRALLLDRLRTTSDPKEQLLIHGAATSIFDQALWGHPKEAKGDDGPDLLRAFIADASQKLQGPSDPAAIESVLLRINDVGILGVRFHQESGARGLVRTVLDARGELPMTKGIAGAARDLAEVARRALFDLDTTQENVSFGTLPPPRRERFDLWRDFLDKEPAGGVPAERDRLARVKDLDMELGQLKYNATRCFVVRQLGEWLSPAEMEARFDDLVAPAFKGDAPVHTYEAVCRLRVALGMEGVDKGRRIALALRLLRSTPPGQRDWDHSLDESGPAIGYPADQDPMRQAAAQALAAHPGWIADSAEIRRWLEEKAMEPIPRESQFAQTWSTLRPAFEGLVAFHVSGAAESKPAVAKSILSTWIATTRDALKAPPASHIYYRDVKEQRIRALGELGRAAGVHDEAAKFLEELGARRSAIVARYMLDLETPATK